MIGNGATLIEIYAPAAPRSLTRSIQLFKAGRYRLARRDAEFYSVMIAAAGAWGRAAFYDGHQRLLWLQPSAFTGSFVLMAGADDGLIVELAGSQEIAPMLTVNWREKDAQII